MTDSIQITLTAHQTIFGCYFVSLFCSVFLYNVNSLVWVIFCSAWFIFVVFHRWGYWNWTCGRGASVLEGSWPCRHGSESNQNCQGTVLKPFSTMYILCAKVLRTVVYVKIMLTQM